MLKVQEFLLSGGTLEQLEEAFALKVRHNEALDVVCLNYDQINSPLGESIVQECRALILERGTWKVKSWPFKKFFNVGEYHCPTDFDWDNFDTLDKEDGSLIHLWHHKNRGWQIATRSVPDAETAFDDSGITFKDLVRTTLNDLEVSFAELTSCFDTDYCYTFELTAPENQVVVYHEHRDFILTGVRNLVTMEEENPEDWIKFNLAPWIKIRACKSYPGLSLPQIQTKVNELNPRMNEGFVLVDKNYNRLKIKSEAYVLMSHSRDSLGKSNRARLELIFTGKEDDVLPILPQTIQDKILTMKAAVAKLQDDISLAYTKISHIPEQKAFAAEANQTPFPGMLFTLRKHPTMKPSDVIKETLPRKILELLSLQEEDTE